MQFEMHAEICMFSGPAVLKSHGIFQKHLENYAKNPAQQMPLEKKTI